MVKDYLKSPEYYARKYILRDVERYLSPSMKVGTAVDCMLSGEHMPFQAADKGSSKNDSIISTKDLEKATIMAKAVTKTDFWKTMTKDNALETQVILEGEIEGMLFCGKPDFVWHRSFKTDTGGFVKHVVIDAKTAQASQAKSAKSFEYACYDYGYFVQLAIYRELMQQNGMEVDELGFLVIGLTADGVPLVRLCRAHPAALDSAFELVKAAVIGIKRQEFTDPVLKWDDSPFIGVPKEAVEEPEPEEEGESEEE